MLLALPARSTSAPLSGSTPSHTYEWNYDTNDRFTAGDTYDNTASSGGIANVYDFENHLIQQENRCCAAGAGFGVKRLSQSTESMPEVVEPEEFMPLAGEL